MDGLVLRVDDRLVHGQILYGWLSGWPADQVWLVNDRIASDPVERSVYQELLRGVETSGILTLDDAILRFTGMVTVGKRILLVLETCEDLARLIRGGVQPNEAHLGNLAVRQGSSVLTPNVALSRSDRNLLLEIQHLGCIVTIRDLPSSAPVSVEKALEETDK